MKVKISKEWVRKKLPLEDGHSVEAGLPLLDGASCSTIIPQFARELKEHLLEMQKNGNTVDQIIGSIEECACDFVNESIFK